MTEGAHGHEHHLTVSRSARYYALGPADGSAGQLWIVLHGYGQLAARFLRRFEPLDDGSRLIVAPEALSRFYVDSAANGTHAAARVGATWMTRDDRLADINDYVSYLDALHARVREPYGERPVDLRVLGFSQGSATASRWVAAGGIRPSSLILWAGLLAHDLDIAAHRHRLGETRLTAVIGDHDPVVSASHVAAQVDHLRASGLEMHVITFAGGHTIDAGVLQALAAE